MLLDRYVGFHHVASADQLFPHHHPRYASPMSLWLMVYRHSPYDHLSALSGAMFSSTRLRARHLSHDAQSVFAFSPCSQFRCKGVPSTTLARNLRRRSDLRAWSRDQMHSPPTDSRKSVVLWVFVIPFYSETPTLRRCIPLVNQCQTLELLIALGIDSDSSASLPSDLTEFTARHTTGEDRIWIDCRFSHITHCCPPVEEPAVKWRQSFRSLPREPNLCFILRPSPYHAQRQPKSMRTV